MVAAEPGGSDDVVGKEEAAGSGPDAEMDRAAAVEKGYGKPEPALACGCPTLPDKPTNPPDRPASPRAPNPWGAQEESPPPAADTSPEGGRDWG